MRKKNRIYMLFIILAVLLIIFSFYLFLSIPVKTFFLDAYFTAGDRIGVGIGNDKELNFGIIYPGANVIREAIVENDFDFPVRIDVSATPEIEEFLFISMNNEIIQPGGESLITFNLVVPRGLELGNYAGIVRVDLRRVFYG